MVIESLFEDKQGPAVGSKVLVDARRRKCSEFPRSQTQFGNATARATLVHKRRFDKGVTLP